MDNLTESWPLVPLVMALVEALKQTNWFKGDKSQVVALALGVVLNILDAIARHGLPADVSAWAQIVLVGLGIGLSASGLYKLIDKRMSTTVNVKNVTVEPPVE